MKCKQFIKNNFENIILFAIMGGCAFVFLLNSPLHPWIGSDTGTDSSVFKTIALLMDEGVMPYRDTFDHKGPLIYILNWLGNKISYYKGIWVIEFLFMTVTFFSIYKIARLSCDIKNSFLIMMVSCSLLFPYFEGGNLTEEFAMPFIASAIYFFVDYLKNNRLSRKRILISGVCLGATLLLRPNMIAVWLVFCPIIFCETFIKREWTKLKEFMSWFMTGVLIVLLPVVVWMALNNSIEQFWNSYIVFNSVYATAEFEEKWSTFCFFFNTMVFIISFFSVLYSCITKRRLVDISYIVYIILNLVLVSMSGINYGHYGMVIVPAVSYPLSLIFEEVEKSERKAGTSAVSMIAWICFASMLVLPNSISFIERIPSMYVNRNRENRSEQVTTVVDIINNYTNEEDAISVYGSWNIIYVLSKRRPATKYSYQFPIGQVKPEIMDEYMEQLQEELPKIVVVQGWRLDDNISEFLQLNNYNVIWGEEGMSSGGALVYLR